MRLPILSLLFVAFVFSGCGDSNSGMTMEELEDKIKTVDKGQMAGYDIDSWRQIIGPPDEERGGWDSKRWVYYCEDGILVLHIEPGVIRDYDGVLIWRREKKPL